MYINEYVVKVASRCNLNCSYCYVYHHADQSYLFQPLLMSEQVVRAAAERIQEHRTTAAHPYVHIYLHGGEPLLFGKERLAHFARTFAEVLGEDYHLGLQTNGVLLDEEWVELLDQFNIGVGISIDGPALHHDRNRVDHRGAGSHARVERAVRLLQSSEAGRRIFQGVIAVIDLACPPETLYAYFRGLGLLKFNILLPDNNWEYLPPIPMDSVASYGEYLTRFFNCWLEEDNPEVKIAFIENAVRLLLGQKITDAFWGLEPVRVAVIETDGSLEPVDYLKICAEGITKQGLNILHDPVKRLVQTGIMNSLLEPDRHLCETCQSCEWKKVCGGGALPHRFRTLNRFDNPSVYCTELQYFLTHMQVALQYFTPSTADHSA